MFVFVMCGEENSKMSVWVCSSKNEDYGR